MCLYLHEQFREAFHFRCDCTRDPPFPLKKFPDFSSIPTVFPWGVLVLLISVQILVRLDYFSHRITTEVWKPARWKTAKNHWNEHTPDFFPGPKNPDMLVQFLNSLTRKNSLILPVSSFPVLVGSVQWLYWTTVNICARNMENLSVARPLSFVRYSLKYDHDLRSVQTVRLPLRFFIAIIGVYILHRSCSHGDSNNDTEGQFTPAIY